MTLQHTKPKATRVVRRNRPGVETIVVDATGCGSSPASRSPSLFRSCSPTRSS